MVPFFFKIPFSCPPPSDLSGNWCWHGYCFIGVSTSSIVKIVQPGLGFSFIYLITGHLSPNSFFSFFFFKSGLQRRSRQRKTIGCQLPWNSRRDSAKQQWCRVTDKNVNSPSHPSGCLIGSQRLLLTLQSRKTVFFFFYMRSFFPRALRHLCSHQPFYFRYDISRRSIIIIIVILDNYARRLIKKSTFVPVVMTQIWLQGWTSLCALLEMDWSFRVSQYKHSKKQVRVHLLCSFRHMTWHDKTCLV